jgi:intracellular multiplication protein IcmP
MNSQQNNPDNMGFLYLMIILTSAVLLLWFFARQWVVIPVFWIREQECHIAAFFCREFDFLTRIFGWHIKQHATAIDQYANAIHSYLVSDHAHKIPWDKFTAINSAIGRYARYPFMLLLLLFAALVYFLSKAARYKTTHTMKSLKHAEVINWPQIKPVINVDLVKADINKGPWAMSQSPLHFCKQHNLVFVKEKEGYQVWGLHRVPAASLLALQVGPRLGRFDQLPKYIKGLLVIFIARAARQRKLSDKFLAQFSNSASGGHINYAGVEEAYRDLIKHNVVSWVQKRHAYVYSYMATMLEIARSDGVLASAEFLWLKPVDRRLWYMLNSVGRQTSLVEIAGGFAHWLAEKKVGRGLKTPMIKEAVNSLEMAVEGMLYEVKGESWRSNAG